MKKVIVVTPDLLGIVKNSEIGTVCYNLALFLSSHYDVTLLFTGTIEQNNFEYWKEFFRNKRIKFEWIEKLDRKYKENAKTSDWFLNKSLTIMNYLIDNHFDIIHFQDWQANGFHTIQAKKTTKYFDESIIFTTMYNSYQFTHNYINYADQNPKQETKLRYCERYCCENSDYIIVPSTHFLDQYLKKGWNITREKAYTIPYLYASSLISKKINVQKIEKLILLAGTETKNYKYFIDTLNKLHCNGYEFKNILIGKTDKLETELSYLDRNIPLRIISDMETKGALSSLGNQPGSLFIIPSNICDFSEIVLECTINQINFIAQSSNDILNIIDEKVIFDTANASDLYEKIIDIYNNGYPINIIKHKHFFEKAKKEILKLHKEISKKFKITRFEIKEYPRVSICIPYYNHGNYLPKTLESVASIDYPNYEVIVVNDGSTDEYSIKTFHRMKQKYKNNNFNFHSKNNEGLGKTRNFAAKKASGEFLLFVDSDNIMKPNILKDLVYAMLKSNADAITCHNLQFSESIKKIDFLYAPVGACLELGFIENIFGDANFIIRKKVFEELKGFPVYREALEDWEFLAKLVLTNHKLEVCPLGLYYYRVLPNSMVRTANLKECIKNIYKLYYNYLPSFFKFFFEGLFLPAFSNKNEVLEKRMNFILSKYKKIALFGFGESGKKSYDYLKTHHKCKLKYIIDDFKTGDYEGIPFITTEEFLKNKQKEVDVVVFGLYQKLNPRLLDGLNIPYVVLEHIV